MFQLNHWSYGILTFVSCRHSGCEKKNLHETNKTMDKHYVKRTKILDHLQGKLIAFHSYVNWTDKFLWCLVPIVLLCSLHHPWRSRRKNNLRPAHGSVVILVNQREPRDFPRQWTPLQVMLQASKLCYKKRTTRPGKHTKSYWTWPFIVDFPMKNGDFPWQNVSSPEGMILKDSGIQKQQTDKNQEPP